MSFPPGTEMFQFPGFALKTLCVQVSSTWFDTLLIRPRAPLENSVLEQRNAR